ncbi:PE domain-containing protein [Brenneria izadpanahii]|uniref:PE domain-containing protein n=1 Tax=Brenneria izadpanahii TaxID=2722756 RepID=A0ABX7UV83_9GAMM|nr:PE domain-containing protein [Brenneria izadpanahii]
MIIAIQPIRGSLLSAVWLPILSACRSGTRGRRTAPATGNVLAATADVVSAADDAGLSADGIPYAASTRYAAAGHDSSAISPPSSSPPYAAAARF